MFKNRWFRLRRRVRFLWQRVFRGFSDEETWSLDLTIARFALPRLKRFKEVNNCYPGHMSENRWDKALDKMIFAMQKTIDDCPVEMSDEETRRKVREGLRLFGKHFNSLWW